MASVALLAATAAIVTGVPRLGPGAVALVRRVTKALAWGQALAASFAPFALWDVAAAVLLVVFAASLVRRARSRRPLWPALSCAVLAVALSAFVFASWATNHYAEPLANELGLAVREYSTDELAEATGTYLERAARLATEVPRGDEGALARQDFYELARIAGSSYAGLAQRYDVFRGPEVPVKALLVWGVPLLYSGHTGMYWAPTGEAGVPLDCAVADTPYIMCHEAAHRLAIASEQEANFAAYLACEANEDARLAYSGAFNAFCYCYNALYRTDPERAQALLQEVAQDELYQGVALVLADWEATSAHYRAYEGPFEEVGTTVNDTYLKSFGETSGVRSYGLVVDYLIAWSLRG